jgi:hypothetical protein
LPPAQEHILRQENGKDRCLRAVRELSQAFALYKAPPFDLNTFRYEQFKDTGQIPEKIKPHFVTILRGAEVGKQ